MRQGPQRYLEDSKQSGSPNRGRPPAVREAIALRQRRSGQQTRRSFTMKKSEAPFFKQGRTSPRDSQRSEHQLFRGSPICANLCRSVKTKIDGVQRIFPSNLTTNVI